MYRRFIATIAAASVAITTLGALPAYADDRDAARAIAAILGLAVVGSIIHDRNKKKKERRYQPAPTYQQKTYKKPHKAQPPRYQQPHVKPRPLPQRVNRKLLPKQCFRNHQTRRGSVQMFSSRCLQKQFHHARSLPSRCEYIFSTLRGDRRGYDARCMRDAGYRLARG